MKRKQNNARNKRPLDGEAKPISASYVTQKFLCSSVGVRHDPDTVEKLLSHERRELVRFIPLSERFEYVATGDRVRSIRGLTKILKGAFYPDYKPPSSRRKGKGKAPLPMPGRKILAERASDTRLRGLTLGTQVHMEMCDWAQMKNVSSWKRKHPTPNAYTVAVIRALNALQLEPVAGEVAIFDESIPFATSIDMVCASALGGKLVLVELKTGYEGYFSEGSGYMAKQPLTRYKNSPLNQAMLQCLMAAIVLERKYGFSECVSCMVLRVNVSGVECYQVPEFLIRRRLSIYNSLKDYVDSLKTKKDRKSMASKYFYSPPSIQNRFC
jgi:hypothetical protein